MRPVCECGDDKCKEKMPIGFDEWARVKGKGWVCHPKHTEMDGCREVERTSEYVIYSDKDFMEYCGEEQ